MKTKIFLTSILCALVISVSAQWNTQTVTNSGYVGVISKMAVDADGYPHIVHRQDNDYLMHSYWTGNTWETEEIANHFNDITRFDIKIDEANIIYVIYGYGSGSPLYLLTKHPNNSWSSILLGSMYPNGGNISMDVTYDESLQDTIIHVSYTKETHLYYGTYQINAAISTNTVVDGNNNVGSNNDIVVDDNGHVHISYYDSNSSGRDLKYAFYNGNYWVTTIVDGLDGDMVGSHTSIDVDSNNEAHISYYDDTNDQLMHVKITPN